MPDTDTIPTEPVPGNPAAHWASTNPEELPSRDQVIGLPRMVLETHTRLGPQATPQQVTDDLNSQGVDATLEDVKACWSESGKLSG
ncbi:hypothetical protein J0H58_22535 [bacterium]|nr:hypothetical protein [bacterium]